jgi:hypothetical protein
VRVTVLRIAVLAVLAYLPMAWNGFVYEDQRQVKPGVIQPVPSLRTVDVLRPGRWLPAQLTRSTPRAAHALSFGLHLLATAGVGLLAWQLGCALWWVPMGLFAVHPLQTEAVAYAVERTELVACVGILIACCACAWRTASIARWALIAVGAYVAMASKESGVAVVGLIALVAWYQQRLTVGIVALLAGAVGFAIRSWPIVAYINARSGVSAWRWIGFASAATWRLLLLTIVPTGLSIEHDYGQVTSRGLAVAAAALISLGVATWMLRDRSRLSAFGMAFVGLALAPRFLVRTPLSILPEHQFYVPMIGASLVLGLALLAAERQVQLAVSWICEPAPPCPSLAEGTDR